MFTYRFQDGALTILDQTRLPGEEVYLTLRTPEDVYGAIKTLSVRGAPAIGAAAAYGFYMGAKASPDKAGEVAAYLDSARPTAVNLRAALKRMLSVWKNGGGARELLCEARAIEEEDRAACRAIGEHGVSLLSPGMGVLTHCNAGALAAAEYGTALAPIYLANSRGYGLKIYCDETRPLLQGARLTAFELMRSGADVTLICDGMAGAMMKEGRVGAVFTGADRVAANGDTANKIGTLTLAVLAKHFGIPFYVCAPFSSIDADCASGSDIVIEERGADEVTTLMYSSRLAPEGVKVRNPAFDVTDAALITALVTERGIIRPPFDFTAKG
ncbi:MAG: S-methyl-5-thioribose-1-phosphate isomerase [Oscillospiraceae bacterium]|jgi:methylthioribose-1-phosphate isomerase|nr:S-methyl-5-thioribose-1-phosphate isomerase [Oscillospiraceae bacterium]